MTLGLTINDTAREASIFRSRAIIAFLAVLILSFLLVARLVRLQVIDHDHFKTLSHNNRVKIVPIAPTRGLIFDRNGVLVAQNIPTFSLEVVPEMVGDVDALLRNLGNIIAIGKEDEQRFRRLLRRTDPFQSVPLRAGLNEEELACFAVHRHRFPGVDIRAELSRYYPLGSLGVHAIGYVGRINEAELQRIDAANYRGTTHIGKVGVEQYHEEILHGRVGYQHVEINAQGRILRVLDSIPPLPGRDLYLSLDVSLQEFAEAILEGERGSIVAIDPQTGGILALVSLPKYDPNLFVDGIDKASYRALLNSPDRPLFNRAIHGQYPPGSTVKPFMGLAGLEYGISQRHGIWCPGWYRLKGDHHKYRDWKKRGHGHVSLKTAIIESCDVYFYDLASKLGIERVREMMVRLGFGYKTGVDLPGEANGLIPSAAWKRQVHHQPWFAGETLIAGIGQGFTLATPLQLASATATLARRGKRIQPHLLERIGDLQRGGSTLATPVQEIVTLHRPEYWQMVIDAMVAVVHSSRGTARKVGLGAAYRMGGKTGTAQVFSIAQGSRYDPKKIPKKLRDHALFIAFAPAEDPQIAVAVVVENGGSGSGTAAPLARKVIDYYLHRLSREPRSPELLLSSSSPPQGPAPRQAAGNTPAYPTAVNLTGKTRLLIHGR